MKAVMLSLHPQWCEKIFNGEKTIEVRKSRPKIDTPFKVYVYMTKRKWIFKLLPFLKNRFAKVIGSFVCDKIISTCGWRLKGHTGRCAKRTKSEEEFPKNACLSIEEIIEYSGNENLKICGWHITEPTLFEKPRMLEEFSKFGYKYSGGCCVNYKCPNCIDNGWMQPPECKIDGCFLTRPPQSWLYIETDEN